MVYGIPMYVSHGCLYFVFLDVHFRHEVGRP
jgi:hypothetical protein